MRPDPRSTVAVEDLLDRADYVRSLARKVVRDASLADDVLQATFVAAIENPPRDGGSSDAWLRRVVRNVASVLRRSEARRREREGEAARRRAASASTLGPTPEPSVESAFDHVARLEAHRRLIEVVHELKEPFRQVVVLRYFEGLTAAEIAKRESLPASTVRGRLQRALEAVRASLEMDSADAAGRAGGGDTRWRSAWIPAMVALGWGESTARAWVSASSGMAAAGFTGTATSGGSGIPGWLAGGLVGGAGVTAAGLLLFLGMSRDSGGDETAATSLDRSDVVVSGPPLSAPVERRWLTLGDHVPPSRPSPPPARPSSTGGLGTDNAPPAPPAPSVAAPTLRLTTRLVDGTIAPHCGVQVDRVFGPDANPPRQDGVAVVVTNEEGRAEIDRLGEGEYELRVPTRFWYGGNEGPVDRDFYSWESVPLVIEDRDRIHEASVLVARFARLTGRVADPVRGPITGANIALSHGVPDREVFQPAAETGPDGAFEIDWAVIPEEDAVVTVRHPWYEDSVRIPVAVDLGGLLDVGTIELRAPVFASVLVRVEAESRMRGHQLLLARLGEPGPDPAPAVPTKWWVPPAATDESAEVRIERIPPGDYRFAVEGRSDVPPVDFTVAEPGRTYEVGPIVIESEPRDDLLYGTVVDVAGRSMPHAIVRADDFAVRTDEVGGFTLRARSLGPHLVEVAAGGGLNQWTREFGPFPFDGTEVRLEMAPAGLALRLVDGDTGEAVAWTRVSVRLVGVDAPHDLRLGMTSDVPVESGSIRLPNHREAGRFRILATVDGYATGEVVDDIPDGLLRREHVVTIRLDRL